MPETKLWLKYTWKELSSYKFEQNCGSSTPGRNTFVENVFHFVQFGMKSSRSLLSRDTLVTNLYNSVQFHKKVVVHLVWSLLLQICTNFPVVWP